MFCKDSSGEYLEERLKDGATRRYRRRRVLGKGGFAKCYQITEELTRQRYACKVIDKEMMAASHLKSKLQSEIEIHQGLSHKNIVKFVRVFEDPKFIYILLELCVNNTLTELLKRRRVLAEVEVRYYMYQVLHALRYLHNSGVVHRDLKLDNFFLGDSLEIKIGDFGLATHVSQTRPRTTICGTPNYIAPEILESKSGYSVEVDVWSLGVTAFLLLYGYYPFENGDYQAIAGRINTKTYLINPSLSDISKSFVSKMLQVRPKERWTVGQLLQHQFFTFFQIPTSLPRSSLACPLNLNFLDQYKNKRAITIDTLKDDEEFNFMLQSRETPSSPKFKHSAVSISMSASKVLQLSKNEDLPYIFSQKKVASFHNNLPQKPAGKMKDWLLQWWHHPHQGLLYQDSQGTMGMRFNDDSNIKSHCFPSKVTFINSKGTKQTLTAAKLRTRSSKDKLLGKLKVLSQLAEKTGVKAEETSEQGVYVRMYLNTLTMFVVWLSNGNLQCRFEDKSELVIGRQHSMYLNANRITLVFASKGLAQQNEEIILKQRRLASLLKRIRTSPEAPSKENVAPN